MQPFVVQADLQKQVQQALEPARLHRLQDLFQFAHRPFRDDIQAHLAVRLEFPLLLVLPAQLAFVQHVEVPWPQLDQVAALG